MVVEADTFSVYLAGLGPRPPFWQVAFELWGDRDFDSDGDALTPDDDAWMCLTLRLRPDGTERIDIDPVSLDPLVLEVRGASEALVRQAASYLVRAAGGSVSDQRTGTP